MLGLLITETAYESLSKCDREQCTLCDQLNGQPVGSGQLDEADLSTSALVSQIPEDIRRIGFSKESVFGFCQWVYSVVNSLISSSDKLGNK